VDDERRTATPAGPPPGPPSGPRDPGDAWAYGADGTKAWGRFGAAGLLVDDGHGRVLLQHRVEWSHHGDTWGIPGGARHQHEDPVTAALRESAEEAGVPDDAVDLRHTAVLDLGFWTYTTVVGRASRPFEPVMADRESLALAWVPVADVDALDLHPGFGRSWAALRATLDRTPHVVVDAANVVGSVPDGWWKDRAGAATRLVEQVRALAAAGVPATALDLPSTAWWPRWTVVLEGEARSATTEPVPSAPRPGLPPVTIDRAAASGDDAVVAAVEAAVAAGDAPVVVVTADRGLRDRVQVLGADVRGPGWLRELLPD